MPSLSGHSIRQICIFNVNSSTSPVINTLKVPNKLEESLRRIFDLLKLESNRRLAIKLVGEERFVVHKISKIKDGSVFYISSLKVLLSTGLYLSPTRISSLCCHLQSCGQNWIFTPHPVPFTTSTQTVSTATW